MKTHIKPFLDLNTRQIILHVFTNELASNKTPSKISEDITDLVMSASYRTKIIVSGIIDRNDKYAGKKMM